MPLPFCCHWNTVEPAATRVTVVEDPGLALGTDDETTPEGVEAAKHTAFEAVTVNVSPMLPEMVSFTRPPLSQFAV